METWMTGEDARRILDFWEAVERIDPIADSWRQSAMICSQLERVVSAQFCSAGAKYEMSKYEDFMPPGWSSGEKKPKAVTKQSAEEQAKLLDAKFR